MTTSAIDILKQCCSYQTSVFLNSNGSDITYRTKIISVNEGSVTLANYIPAEYIADVCRGSEFNLQAKMFRMKADSMKSDGKNIVIPLGEFQSISETRESERFPFDPEEHVICLLENPYDGKTFLKKRVLDMSANGLSVSTNKSSKLFTKGTVFDRMQILVDHEIYSESSGEIVYTRKLIDETQKLQIQVGFRLSTNSY